MTTVLVCSAAPGDTSGGSLSDRAANGRASERRRPHGGKARGASSCFAGCRAVTTRCRRRSASARTPAGAARSSQPSRQRPVRACSTSRRAPAWSPRSCSRGATATVVRRRPERRDARRRPRAVRRRRARRADRGRGPSGFRSPTGASMRSRSPICCATSRTRPRRSASSRASSSRRARRLTRVRGAPLAPGARGVARVHRGRAARAGMARVARVVGGRALSRAEQSEASMRVIRWSGSSATGAPPGLIDVTVRRMSLGGGIVISATRGVDASGA